MYFNFFYQMSGSRVDWDIRDVWTQVKDTPIEQVPIETFAKYFIEMWNHFDSHHLERTQQADLSYPVICSRSLHPAFMIIDGYHRLYKHYLLGNKTVPVQYIEEMPTPTCCFGSPFTLPHLKFDWIE